MKSGDAFSTSRSIATLPVSPGHEQRVLPVRVLQVHVGARGDQRPRDVHVIAERRGGDRRAPVRATLIDVRAVFQEPLDGRQVAALGGVNESGGHGTAP